MQHRLPKLPDIEVIKLLQTTPSLVIAYQYNGSTDSEQQIVERNRINKPGFVSGDIEIIKA
jgi:prophage DNA circulation protein